MERIESRKVLTDARSQTVRSVRLILMSNPYKETT